MIYKDILYDVILFPFTSLKNGKIRMRQYRKSDGKITTIVTTDIGKLYRRKRVKI